MKQFNDHRIETYNLNIKNNVFPFTKILPINKISETLVIFIPGLNANSNFIKYFNNNAFDNVYFISFDQRAQSKNEMNPSMNYKTYLKDLNLIINNYLCINKDIKKIYLIGESWGSNLAFLYDKYFPNKVDGVLGWNMPYEVIDTSKKEDNNLILKIKIMITLMTGIDTYEKSILSENTTNNKALKRLIINSRRIKISNKVIIASWKSFKKSWKYFLKNEDKNFLYIQSKDDILMSKKIFKNSKDNKNIIFLNKGTHLLSFDINMSKKLFKIIKEFIEK